MSALAGVGVLSLALVSGCGTEGEPDAKDTGGSSPGSGSASASPSTEAKEPVVGDINSDGYGDAMVQAASLMELTSDGTAFEMATSPLSRPEAICDFDGDAVPDGISETLAPKGSTVDTYSVVDAEGNTIASIKRQRRVKGMVVNGVHCGDFDGDGRADLGLEEDPYSEREMDRAELHDVATMRERFTVYRQVAAGKLGKPQTWLETETPRGEPGNAVFDTHFTVGDLNGDAKDDLVIFVDYTTAEFMMDSGLGAMCGQVAAYSNGTGFRRGPVQKFRDNGAGSGDDADVACGAIPADTDGDGAEELVGLDTAGKADVWSAKGGKWSRTKASTRPKKGGKEAVGFLYATDVNGDGLTDLISIAGADTASVMLHAAQTGGALAAPKPILKLSMGEDDYEAVPTRMKPRK